ncbi:MAG: helix-turn-helix domain-containing protein [Acidobacteriota bacterium]|nr:helix-turn-helix domain-containing protein [Acidobacteriota bacterium]
MGKIKVIKLNEKQKAELEKGYREGESHAFRQRCHLILLKSKGQTSVEAAAVLDCCEMAVNNWVKRYLAEGIEGLKTRPGRGGKPILKVETDLDVVREAVSRHRQRISLARAELESELGKQFSDKTLNRFVKKTIVATNGLGEWENASRLRKFIGSNEKD